MGSELTPVGAALAFPRRVRRCPHPQGASGCLGQKLSTKQRFGRERGHGRGVSMAPAALKPQGATRDVDFGFKICPAPTGAIWQTPNTLGEVLGASGFPAAPNWAEDAQQRSLPVPADLAASSAAGGRAVHPQPRRNAPQLPGVPFPCTLLPRLVRGAQGPRVPALRSPGGGGRPAGVRGGVLQLLWLPCACVYGCTSGSCLWCTEGQGRDPRPLLKAIINKREQ